MLGLNSDQLKQFGSTILGLVGMLLINNNVITSDQWTNVAGAITSIVGSAALIWGVVYPIWKQMHKNQLASAAAVPGAKVIEIDMAKASPGAKAAVNDNGTITMQKIKAAA